MRRAVALAAVCLVAGCVSNPYSGRRQLMLVDASAANQMGAKAYQEILAQAQISTAPAIVDPLHRVGRRIASVVEKRQDFDWEFSAIVDDQANAFALPGGKVAFFTGIYPVLQDEAGMAFVMAHEIAHVLLDHGAERMSQQMLAGGAGALLDAYLGTRDVKGEQIYRAAYGVAAGVGFLLPFSRLQESEADALGLKLMAEAGYDPRQAVEVWRRMAQAGGEQPPEFLSTHPSHGTRIEDLQSNMDKALAVYRQGSPAPVAKLPEPPRATKDAGATASALRLAPGSVMGEALGFEVEPTAGGEGARAVFEFAFSQDVFVRTVRLSGPGLESKEFRVDAGVPGRVARRIRADLPALRAGEYVLTFAGQSSGRPFRIPVAYEVR